MVIVTKLAQDGNKTVYTKRSNPEDNTFEVKKWELDTRISAETRRKQVVDLHEAAGYTLKWVNKIETWNYNGTNVVVQVFCIGRYDQDSATE